MSNPASAPEHSTHTPEHETRHGLWESLTTVHINPLNKKCTTLPILNLRSQYARNFHLSWLGFWVAFLSWFAFSPLVPAAVKKDLNLTAEQIGNSNVISLCATLIVRIIVGPLVDRYGPRKIMAGLLVLGAIPSGLAGTVTTASGLYVIRFFIGILGGTFVPCQAWTTAFFDTRVVGRANALAGGWGNSGGGFTFLIMAALYDRLLAARLSAHVAWRAAFAIVPVPALLLTAALVMLCGTDHPNGRWADRHGVPAARMHAEHQASEPEVEGEREKLEHAQKYGKTHKGETKREEDAHVQVDEIDERALTSADIAVSQSVTLDIAYDVLVSPLTWLPSIAYLSTFGYELAIEANLSTVLFGLYSASKMGQTKAGYVASAYGLMNVWARPLGGWLGDALYSRYGVRGKKYLTLGLGVLQGLLSIALGLYIDSRAHPDLGAVVGVFVVLAVANEMGNGANFSLVPHCNPNSNGLMTGLVGALGNLGGVIFALIFRFQPLPYGKAFWISGILATGVNVLLVAIRAPRR